MPSITTYDFIQGDTRPVIRIDLRDKLSKQVLSIFGLYTATLVWKIDDLPTVSRAMTVLSGTEDGSVEYQFSAGELQQGVMHVQVRLTEILTGNVLTTLNPIRKTIGPNI